MNSFGGGLSLFVESDIIPDFEPKADIIQLLKQYWGQNASFRILKVYKNPDSEKTVMPISQGLIVENIISEYKRGKCNEQPRDLFLTAPTGAGKSLLFQLPAFYISARNDVTIIISPLIALMKDQVEQVRVERNFNKIHYLNSELSLVDRDKVIEGCKNGDIDILYMSPELFLSYDISFFIGGRNLGLLVIDEAHLITTWGRDFRVDYWFLGQHINKIRKNHNYRFPMVAVTATAIYGGDNDMVFDSISSLYMYDPYLYIGEVKRNDITYVIDNHEHFKSNYDLEKERETAMFIEKMSKLNIKTLVYVPYKKHIDKIVQNIDAEIAKHVVSYHSGLTSEAKNWAYLQFRENKVCVMLATKAFGMGIDISDIQVVYHHAPSGLLPDYIQEIGRVARKKELRGFAALSYAIEDQKYSKILYGMSSIKRYQILEVLKKIYKLFKLKNEKRNLLVSTDDFGHIFNNALDLNQKVMTILMMIEKDYLAKYRYNVLIARPKKMFVKVYARTNQVGLNLLKFKYPKYYKLLSDNGNDQYNLLLDLDEIWQERFSDQSFPLIKRMFYNGELLKDDGIVIKPLIKVSFSLEQDYQKVYNSLERLLSVLNKFFTTCGSSFFLNDDLLDFMAQHGYSKMISEKIVKFVLSAYSGRTISFTEVEKNAFLQRRRTAQMTDQYRIFNGRYKQSFATIKTLLSKMFADNSERSVSRYVSNSSEYLLNYIKLGSLLEIMDLATFESSGGDNPMLFIRINDPIRILHDINDPQYENILLRQTYFRHKSSSEIFDHFFLHSFQNRERWNLIEDFFLGASNEELLREYPGKERNHIDIVKYLTANADSMPKDNMVTKIERDNTLHIFAPIENEFFDGDRLLTISNKTLKISKWLSEDPVSLDKIRREFKLKMPHEILSVLFSKLQNYYFPYFRDLVGLSLKIEFKGYDTPVKARIVYDNEPVKFYQWWRKNQDKVSMSKKEFVELLIRVNQLDPQTLLKKHRDILLNKKF